MQLPCATTIKLLSKTALLEDLVQPGHFPLLAKPGGVLRRLDTEAAIDLAKLAGLNEAAFCEILNDDGTMSRLPELINLANEHDLKIGTIESLIQYRENEKID